MMLAWSPPLVMMPWMRASGLICCRIWSRDTKSWIMAFRALTPLHGHDGDGRPGAPALYGRAKRRGQAPHAALPPRSLPLQEGAQPARRLLFVKAELGGGVDLMRDLLEVVGETVHRIRDLGLGLIE